MKKLAVSILLFACFLTGAFAQDFRNVEWGMTPEQVIKHENASKPTVAKDGTVNYHVEIAGYSMELQYAFDPKDHLVLASYYTYPQTESWLQAYQWLKSFFFRMHQLLDLKYGEPSLPFRGVDYLAYTGMNSGDERYLNYDLSSFLDPGEAQDWMIAKLDPMSGTTDMADLGYKYWLKYVSPKSIIMLSVSCSRAGGKLTEEIDYMPPYVYQEFNARIKNSLLKKGNGL